MAVLLMKVCFEPQLNIFVKSTFLNEVLVDFLMRIVPHYFVVRFSWIRCIAVFLSKIEHDTIG